EEGLDLLSRLQSADPTLPVVIMTAWANVELAVEAMRRGARDFVAKPWENLRLLSIVRNQIELGGAVRAYRRLEQENQLLRGGQGPALIAQSAAMRPVLELVARVGPSDANILITGENGTGKGLVAQAVHGVSRRAGRPFIPVNMGGLPEGVFESELFGHVRGAFTDAKGDRAGRFELAEGGTLFLDEIGNIPAAQQAKILRVLERGEFERVGSSRTIRADVRLISASNADIGAEVAAGRFRQDLLFRLNTIQIHLPPLRERREDIGLLSQHFLGRHAERYGKAVTGFDEEAVHAMRGYAWPGNVRELDHSVERAVLMAQGKVVRAADLALNSPAAAPRLDDMSLEEVEAFLIKKTLARCDGNARKAAELLGLSRSAFYRRLDKYGL
ncbi:MAG TPA: sigma-54 dependent transcriptional regulator, partial [Opitutaceae bacterium]|nr:sigma-54 dependent transcriptional regulator [Opitutaceae bacterium]